MASFVEWPLPVPVLFATLQLGGTTAPGDMQILYSTNTQLKFVLQRDYFGGLHYAWCSPVFDPRTLGRYTAGSLLPSSSNPATIYRDLHEATVKTPDWHCKKIDDQKATLMSLAVKLAESGNITEAARDEVTQIVRTAPITEWRPLLYIIPYTEALKPRIKEVPLAKRASREMEYIVEDLRVEEFHVVEFPT